MKMGSTELQREFEAMVERVGRKLLESPWENEAFYAQWIAQTYYFVRHTTSLVCLTALQYGPNRREQHYHALAHLADERGHDKIALDDLTNLGWSLADVPELPETSVFYQNQYYMIQHQGPASHLGYSLVLEGLASRKGPQLAKRLTSLYGRPCTEFIELHATVDQDHFGSGLKALAELSPEEIKTVLKNLRESAVMYEMILDRCAACAKAQVRKSA